MAYMPTVAIELDGVPIELKLAQGDYVRAEADGVDQAQINSGSFEAIARVTFHALQRAKRKGLVALDVPETWDDFLDAFSLADEQPEETDPKGSSQGQPTG